MSSEGDPESSDESFSIHATAAGVKIRTKGGSRVLSEAESKVVQAYSSTPPSAFPTRPQTAVPRRRRPPSARRKCSRGRIGRSCTDLEDPNAVRSSKRPKSARACSGDSRREGRRLLSSKQLRAPMSAREIRGVRIELDNFVGHFTVSLTFSLKAEVTSEAYTGLNVRGIIAFACVGASRNL